jgi:hypothetical protein
MLYAAFGNRTHHEFNGYCTLTCHRCGKPSLFGLAFETGRAKAYGVQTFSHSEKQLATLEGDAEVDLGVEARPFLD